MTLIGANGAGKSTTLRAITGIVPVKSGSITYEGEEPLQGESVREAYLGKSGKKGIGRYTV